MIKKELLPKCIMISAITVVYGGFVAGILTDKIVISKDMLKTATNIIVDFAINSTK